MNRPSLLVFSAIGMSSKNIMKHVDVYSNATRSSSVIEFSYLRVFRPCNAYTDRVAASIPPGPVHVHAMSGGMLGLSRFADRYPDIANRISSMTLDSPCSAEGLGRSASQQFPRPVSGLARFMADSAMKSLGSDVLAISKRFEQKVPRNILPTIPVIVFKSMDDAVSDPDSIDRLFVAWSRVHGSDVRMHSIPDCAHVNGLRVIPDQYLALCLSAVDRGSGISLA